MLRLLCFFHGLDKKAVLFLGIKLDILHKIQISYSCMLTICIIDIDKGMEKV